MLGATVFLDTNGDGKLDGDELSTQSDAYGIFTFDNRTYLAGGDYRVAVVPERGMIFTTPDSLLVSGEPGMVAYASFGMRPGGELPGRSPISQAPLQIVSMTTPIRMENSIVGSYSRLSRTIHMISMGSLKAFIIFESITNREPSRSRRKRW